MQDKTGVYVFVTPSERNSQVTEYRIIYLEEPNTIGWTQDLPAPKQPEVLKSIKSKMDQVKVFKDRLDADEEADRVAESLHITNLPIYHVYCFTPYPQWSVTSYAKEHQN